MKTKTIYVANDGEEFESEKECLEYEKDISPYGKVLLFDHNYKLIKDSDPISAFKKTCAIYIINAEKAEKFFAWIYENSEFYNTPENVKDKQIFIYNEDTGEYSDLREKVSRLEMILSDILVQTLEENNDKR